MESKSKSNNKQFVTERVRNDRVKNDQVRYEWVRYDRVRNDQVRNVWLQVGVSFLNYQIKTVCEIILTQLSDSYYSINKKKLLNA